MRLVVITVMARALLRISTQSKFPARRIAADPARRVGMVFASGRSHMAERSTGLIAEREGFAEKLRRKADQGQGSRRR